MVPTIGVMIGGYIIFRCLEIACRSKNSFASAGARTVVLIAAIVGILVTGFLVTDLLLSPSGLAGTMATTRSNVGSSPEPRCGVNEYPGLSGCECIEGYRRNAAGKCIAW